MRRFFLKTERLAFSVWACNDMPLALSLWGDASVTRHIVKTGRFTEREIAARLQTEIDNFEQYGVQYWPVFLKGTAAFIGCCGLRPYNSNEKIYELGFHIRSAYWGRGFGTEAARAVMEHAFTALDASELFAGHSPYNASSKRVLEKLGFTYTGSVFYAPTGLCHPSYRFTKSGFTVHSLPPC